MTVLVVHSCYANKNVVSKLSRCYQTENNSKRKRRTPRFSSVFEMCAKVAPEGISMDTNQNDELPLAPRLWPSLFAFFSGFGRDPASVWMFSYLCTKKWNKKKGKDAKAEQLSVAAEQHLLVGSTNKGESLTSPPQMTSLSETQSAAYCVIYHDI